MTTSKTRAVVLCALLASTCICGHAFAQSQPPYKNVDANGVDLTDGSFNFDLIEGSIGSGRSEMSLVSYIDGGSNWPQVFLNQTRIGSTYSLIVSLGNTFDTFAGTSTSLTSSRATGATLTFTPGGDYVYHYPNGTKITFRNTGLITTGPSNLCTSSSPNNCVVLASSIAGGDGLTITYNWDLYKNCVATIGGACTVSRRLKKVSNNAGYAINFAFVSDATVPHQNPAPEWFKRASAQFTNANMSATSWPTVTYSYPSTNVRTVTTAGGKQWRFTGGSNSWAIKRPGASIDTTTVIMSSNVVTSVTRDGVTTSYNRSLSGATSTVIVTDAAGKHTTVVSDMSLYRPTSVKDALNHTTTYQYDTLGNLTFVTYPENNQTKYTYDTRGNVIETRAIGKTGAGPSDIVTTAGFDATCDNELTCNKPHWTKDALTNQTDYTYDPATGNVLTVTAPAATSGGVGPKTTYSYTTISGLQMLTGISACQTTASCAGTADETKTAIGYNANLLPNTVTNGAGDGSLTATTTISYDAIGNTISVDGPLLGPDDTELAAYDADRALVNDMGGDPDGAGSRGRWAHRYTYNADGQRTLAETGTVPSQATNWGSFVPAQATQSSYDANARKVSDTLISGGTTYSLKQYSYDVDGRPDCAAQRMNSATFGSLPASACTPASAGSNGPDRIARNSYDDVGRVTKITTGYATSDASDDVTTVYTDNGQVASVTDGQANATNYTYDVFDRPSKTTYVDGSFEQFGYDANGNVTSRVLRDGTTISYAYDNLDRLKTKTLPGGELAVSYAYDLPGRLTSAATSAQTVSLGWDALGRQTNEIGPLGTIGYQYDVAGNRTAIVWPDNAVTTYAYDATSAMAGIYQGTGTSTVMTSYGYDDLGRRTSMATRYGASTSYSYDPVSRLGGLSQAFTGTANNVGNTFSYNPAGQVASRTSSNDSYAWNGAVDADRSYTPNGLNQYTSAGTTSFGYDARGNLTSSGSLSYGYSAENRLTSAPGAALSYDPLGRLYQITTSSVTTRFQYAGAQIAAEYDGSNNRLRRFVPGATIDEPALSYEGASIGPAKWYHTDERGSVIATSDTSGARASVNSYDEYGIPSSNNAGRFQYTGQAYLPEIGLYYYKARMYSPTLGRFLQTDPIGYGDGLNWYNYVGSDPVNNLDPSGLLKTIACPKTEICVTAKRLKPYPTVTGSTGGYGGEGRPNGGSGHRPAPPSIFNTAPLRSTTSDNDAEDFDPTKDIVVNGGPVPKSERAARASEYATAIMTETWAVTLITGAYFGWDEAAILERLGLTKFRAAVAAGVIDKATDDPVEKLHNDMWNIYFNFAWRVMERGGRIGGPPAPQWGPDGPDDGPD